MDESYTTRSRDGLKSILRLVLNILTVLALAATAIVLLVSAIMFINPYNPMNPYPPPTLPPTLGPPTATNTPAIYLPPTSTLSPTIPPTPTDTQAPTATPAPTDTPMPTPEESASPELTPGGAQFQLAEGSPSYSRDERGCEVMGVGGKVFDLAGAPISGLTVRLNGELAGQPVGPLDSLTGSAADRFGFGAYYFELSDQPVASQNTLWIQILDSSSGLPLSDQVFFNTTDICDENLILINWRQARP
jgi:type VI secretion system secreted protein VgrG